MLPDAVREEARSIAEIAMQHLNGNVALGMGEMPAVINLALGLAVCKRCPVPEDVDKYKPLVYLAFLMGRQFGRMEERRGLGEIVENVHMVITSYPTGLYNMHDCGIAEEELLRE